MLPGEDHVPWLGGTEAWLGEVEEFLTGARHVHESDRTLATVLFTDIVGSTTRAAELGDAGWHELVGRHHEIVRAALRRFRGREVKTIGDGFMAVFDGPGRAVRCAREIVDGTHSLGIEVRAGLHTGECELSAEDARGLAVNIAARIAALAGRREVLVSSTVHDLVFGSELTFEDRGTRELKGLPGPWRLFAASEGSRPTALPAGRQLRVADRMLQLTARRTPRLVPAVVSTQRRSRQ